MGPACAGAAGTRSACVATPAASAPLMTVRRFRLMAFSLWIAFVHPSRGEEFRDALWFEIFSTRPGFAVVDRVLEELVGIVGPELADVRIGLDHRIDQLAALLLDLADIDVTDHVAVFVEAHRTAAGFDLVARAQRGLQRVLVLDLAAD